MPKTISAVEGNNVSLVGFDALDSTEIEKVRQFMAAEIKKIEEHIDYTELRIRLKVHPHGKSFMHELDAELFLRTGKSLDAAVTDKNLFRGISAIISKLLSEIEHSRKKDPHQRPIRKITYHI